MTFPIGIGRTGFQTPAATTKIVAKIVNPTLVSDEGATASNTPS